MTITHASIQSRSDEHGNPVSGTAEAIALYDRTIDRLSRFHVDVLPLVGELTEEHPDFPLGHAVGAYLSLNSTDPAELPAVRRAADHLRRTAGNDRERAHLAAIDAWAAGEWRRAARILDDLLIRWPTDLLALVLGHQLDFFLGDAQNLRDRVGRSLDAFDPAHPHHGLVAGMHAFGLEECGHYEQAEAAGCYAVEANPDDVWGVHAVAHTYEMRGRVDDGIRFLRRRDADWGDGNFLAVHNWWHLALYLLEAGRTADALAIYDTRVHHAGSQGVALEMVDASALLWRLFVDGEDTGDRFSILADAWASYAAAEPWYAFNDVHAVMALAGAGRTAEARAVIERLARVAAEPATPGASNHTMTSAVGLPASRAVLAFAEGRHHDVLADLLPIRAHLARFGGSHAQRDALVRTAIESAIAAGDGDLARALVRERLSVRESSVHYRLREARIAALAGDAVAARAAEHEAAVRRRRFAAAYTSAVNG
jgi:tetratricopeptide (TPR) repeat protein